MYIEIVMKTKDWTRLAIKHNSISVSVICWMLYIQEKIYKQNFDENSFLPKSNKIAKGIITV